MTDLHEMYAAQGEPFNQKSHFRGEVGAMPVPDPWIKVEDALPEIGREVAVCDSEDHVYSSAVIRTDSDKTAVWRHLFKTITHWQRLPDPPKRE